MISSKKELAFYLKADRMMNRGKFTPTLADRITDFFLPDYTMRFLVAMRHVSYYSQNRSWGGKLLLIKWLRRFNRYSFRLGYSIGPNVFGYVLVLPHNGTIVVGGKNIIGNYAVLHTSTCIVDSGSEIGDGLYLSTGAVISKRADLGDNVTIGVNSMVNKSFKQNNVLLTGSPAKVQKNSEVWYVRDGERYEKRVHIIEELKRDMLH